MTYTINGVNPERITYAKQIMLIIEKIAELKQDIIDVVIKTNSITISQKKKNPKYDCNIKLRIIGECMYIETISVKGKKQSDFETSPKLIKMILGLAMMYIKPERILLTPQTAYIEPYVIERKFRKISKRQYQRP